MPMIGGDLAAMDALARRFDLAGAHFRSESAELVRRVADAIDAYTVEMRALDGDARALDEEIGATLGRLRAQADATVWTGAHRQQQEAARAGLEADIAALRSTIERFLLEAAAIVRGSLSGALSGMQGDVEQAGQHAEGVATSFARSVARQRAAFDLVMNG